MPPEPTLLSTEPRNCIPVDIVDREFQVRILGVEGLPFSVLLCMPQRLIRQIFTPDLIDKDMMYDAYRKLYETKKSLADCEIVIFVEVKLYGIFYKQLLPTYRYFGRKKINRQPMVTQFKPTTFWCEWLKSGVLFRELPRVRILTLCDS